MKHFFKNKSLRAVLFGAVVLSVFCYACKKKDKDDDVEDPQDHVHKTAIATINKTFNDTAVSGTATFTQMNDEEVKLTLDITVPSRAGKSVAVHLHMMNDCSNNGGGAMGHWNPTNSNHGKLGTPVFHLGDIGNIDLDASGHAKYIITTNAWNINGSDATRNVVGKSIIVHSGVDDYTSQPSGNSGNRIGCGGIAIQ